MLAQTNGLDWIEQCFTSPPTQYRLYGRRSSTDEAMEFIQVVTGFCALDTELSPKKSSFVRDLSCDTIR